MSVSLRCCDNRFISFACLNPRSQAVSGRLCTGTGGVFSASGDFRFSAAASIAFSIGSCSVGKIGRGGANML